MNKINDRQLKQLIEATLFVADKALSVHDIKNGVLSEVDVTIAKIKTIIQSISDDYKDRGVTLVKLAGGYRFQTLEMLTPYLKDFFSHRSIRLSRASLETLAIIAYKQPVTRAEIELIRGVSVTSPMMSNLIDRQWVKNLGKKEVPGRPSMYGTTKEFLEYFGLDNLTQLPELADNMAIDTLLRRDKK